MLKGVKRSQSSSTAVRSLPIEQGFPDPFFNCLRLQRVLKGVKRSQGSSTAQRLPITDSLLLVIHRALDLQNFDHCAFWVACLRGYFGFLRAAEFAVPNLASFSPALHLSVATIAVDSFQSPTCLRARIKASKTDPFRQGCHIHIGHLSVQFTRCWLTSLSEEMSLAPCSFLRMVNSVSRTLNQLAAANFLSRGD